MKKLTLFILTILSTWIISFGQTQKATTENGKKVILFSNMTWKYEEVKKDTTENSTTSTKSVNCNYRTNETDEFTGKKKLALVDEDFIKYTSDEMKPYYKNKDYITCKVSCARIGSTKVIYLYWTIQTNEGYKYYGSIEKDSKFMVKLKNGEIVELSNGQYDTGETDYDRKITKYSPYILIDDEQFNKLISNGIEKIRMYWSKGYEEYSVINESVLLYQLNCIK